MGGADIKYADDGVAKDVHSIAADSLDEANIEQNARIAAAREHELTFFEAVKLYPTAVAWALFFSLGVIMAVR